MKDAHVMDSLEDKVPRYTAIFLIDCLFKVSIFQCGKQLSNQQINLYSNLNNESFWKSFTYDLSQSKYFRLFILYIWNKIINLANYR